MPGTTKIVKLDITQADTDCIVNAANTGLQGGGGVCGAIFNAAGYSELKAACNKIGGCPVGGAEITPGFALKAKYIIHAVGPRWYGGERNEESYLISAYKKSLKLATEHDCHSITFPLISAGIFRYPLREAWEAAFKAIDEFRAENEEYYIDIDFAVISDENIAVGEKVMNGEEEEEKIVRFHNPADENGCLSNWYMSNFEVGGKKYCCVEQYMMEQKALLFHDDAAAQQIMATTDPAEMQKLGRGVKGFNSMMWNGFKQNIVMTALNAKFSQNEALKEFLIGTGDRQLVECSKTDKIWGIGLGMDDPDAEDTTKWKGQNLLGFTMMMVRDNL